MDKIKVCIILLAALVFAVSCNDASEGSGMALVNLRLIDAPGDFDEAWIEIEGVEVMLGKDRQGTDAEWVYLPYDQPNQKIDVSKLVGEGVLLLARAEVPVGAISKIKLILGNDHHLMKKDKRRSLTLKDPGGHAFEIEADYRLERSLSYDIYLDLDLERSILSTSDTTQFLLQPKVRSFIREERGEIKGEIEPISAKPVIYAIRDGDTVTTLSDAQGVFALRGLEEGEHTLHIIPRPPFLDTLFSIETIKGEAIQLDDIFLRLPSDNLNNDL